VNPQPTPENAVSINAVGNLQVDREISTGLVQSGETIELVTTVEGSGNIPLVRRPEYNLPDGLDLFTPEETSNIERRGQSIRGNKTFTELLVARAPGTYEIPSERVAIFNPRTRSFRYQTLPALEFTVQPGFGNQFTGTGSAVSVPLQPMGGLAVWHNGSNRPVYHSYWFWILLALPAIAIAVALQQKSLRKKLSTDQKFARAHHAFDRAEERIESAYQHIDSESKDVYSILHKALSGFITDSLGLQEAGLSDNELIEQMKNKGDEKLVQQLRYLLTKCATISYAPSGGREDVKSDIEKTENLIKAMRKKF
ncbi:MAG: BatD family protein, partial [Balneolaceae bacterium]